MRSPGGLVALVVVLVICAVIASRAAAASRAAHSERALLAAMNRARTSRGLGAFRVDAHLRTAARAHSAEMLRYGYFGHGEFGRRLSSFGVSGPFVGENLAWGKGIYSRAVVIVAEWLSSPEHRANLLRPGFRRVGIGSLAGRFAGQTGVLMVTADFAGS